MMMMCRHAALLLMIIYADAPLLYAAALSRLLMPFIDIA